MGETKIIMNAPSTPARSIAKLGDDNWLPVGEQWFEHSQGNFCIRELLLFRWFFKKKAKLAPPKRPFLCLRIASYLGEL